MRLRSVVEPLDRKVVDTDKFDVVMDQPRSAIAAQRHEVGHEFAGLGLPERRVPGPEQQALGRPWDTQRLQHAAVDAIDLRRKLHDIALADEGFERKIVGGAAASNDMRWSFNVRAAQTVVEK